MKWGNREGENKNKTRHDFWHSSGGEKRNLGKYSWHIVWWPWTAMGQF